MTPDEIKAFIAAVVRAQDPGYSVVWDAETAYTWDGCCLSLYGDAVFALHEVAHLLLCPRSRRSVPEFGLGTDPGRRLRVEVESVVSHDTAAHEESRTCTLHWALAAYCGGAEAAACVESYTNIQRLPQRRSIQRMALPGLPQDFVETVLSVLERSRADKAVVRKLRRRWPRRA